MLETVAKTRQEELTSVEERGERPASAPRVLIVGAGFGGLRVARGLVGAPVDVTIIDRHNYQTFQPLLYQVATAGLEAETIVQPVRRILQEARNVEFRLAEATGIDLDRRLVLTDAGEMSYDYLVLAAGSVTNFFGLDSLAQVAHGLKDLDEAEALRDHILTMFEKAAHEPDPQRRQRLMTTVVVGGGSTGVELAGALAELKAHVLPRDYPGLDVSSARLLLLEAMDRLLPTLPRRLQREARQKLESMGVEVRLNAAVADANTDGILLRSGDVIPAGTIIWVAGVRASPLAQALGIAIDRAGRVMVRETLQLPGRPEVYVIGDMAHVAEAGSSGHPMVAPVAVQQGDVAAANIRQQVSGGRLRHFSYKDRGMMVTIGRHAAVAHAFGLQLSGFLAWVIWLTVHLFGLIGFRNRLLVLVNWAWNYFTYERGVRLIRNRRLAMRSVGGSGKSERAGDEE